MLMLEQLYPVLLIVSGLALAILAGFIWLRRRRASFAVTAVLVLGLCTVWTFGYASELYSRSLATAILSAKVQYLGIAAVPTLWFVLTVQYTRHEKWLTRRNLALLALVPALTVALVATNELHGWIWPAVELRPAGPYTSLEPTFGPALWASIAYSYSLLALSTVLVVRFLLRSNAYYRGQITATLVAGLAPWLASIHDVFQIDPYSAFDLTPLGFTFAGIILSWNFLRLRMADILPVARGVVLESMEDAVIVLDPLRRVVDLNTVAAKWLGVSVPGTIGRSVTDVWAQAQGLLGLPEDEVVWSEIDFEVDGARRKADMRVSPLRDRRERPVGWVVVLRDITERKQAEQALRESEARYALSAQGTNDGMWDWDLRRHAIYFSPRWKSMLGYAEEEINDSPEEWFSLVHPDDKDRLRGEIKLHLENGTPNLESEYRILHKDGTYRWMLCRSLAVREENGEAHRLAGSQTDITERKAVEQQLKYDALHDALTGLPNRNALLQRLSSAVERLSRRPDYSFAVLFMDLDRFKVVNDSLGHLAGDELLVAVARRLQACMRQGDTIARLGGDEFVVLLDNIHESADAMRTADRIQQQLRSPFVLNGQRIFTTVSIGIALSDTGYRQPHEMLRDADTAMYRAKVTGKARYELFNPSMHAQAVEQLRLEVDLRRALEMGEFRLHYQPIYSIRERQVLGLEALLRWEHPKRGLLYPGEFLPVAEETGLILPIGAWVLREACRQLRVWREGSPELGDIAVTVNLSSQQLDQPDLVEQVRRALAEAAVPASGLRLEITEDAVMKDPDRTGERVRALRAMGVQIYLDDFGTGASSLSVLHDFPVDVLKIDPAFVSRLSAESRNAEIVRTIVALAESLEIEVIAEGVETHDQLEQLKSLRCKYGQGRVLAEPEEASLAFERLALITV